MRLLDRFAGFVAVFLFQINHWIGFDHWIDHWIDRLAHYCHWIGPLDLFGQLDLKFKMTIGLDWTIGLTIGL